MDLSNFLQKDIIKYLEQIAAHAHREDNSSMRSEELSLFNEDRDYAKETSEALEQNNLTKAKSIFDELCSLFNKHNDNDEEREKIYSILDEVYKKIVENLKKQPYAMTGSLADFTKKSLNDHLQEAMQRSLPPPMEEIPPTQQPPHENEVEEQTALREQIKEELNNKKELTQQAIEKNDLEKAIIAYRAYKDSFNEYPEEDRINKMRWYDDVFNTYNKVRQLKEELQAKEEQQQMPPQEIGASTDMTGVQTTQDDSQQPTPVDKNTLKNIKQTMRSLIDELEEGDLTKAEQLLMQSRQSVAALPDDSKEKDPLESILSTITDRLTFYKQHPQAQFTDKQIEELYEEGVHAQHNDEEGHARHYFEEVLRLDPEYKQAQIRLGSVQNDNQGGQGT